MYIMMAQKASALIKKYNITEFPVPVHIVEQIIVEKKYKIEILKYLRDKAVTIEDAVLVGNVSGAAYRECLVHESCHIQYHAGNQLQKDKWQVAKDEGQAQAFAAYFLMPLGAFERAAKEHDDDYTLSEQFGVSAELVRLRKQFTRDLLENGYHDLLKGNFF